MRKITYLLIMVLLAAMLQAAETLKVDFGTTSTPVQSGYQAYTAADKNLASFTTQSYDVFGTTVSVLAQWTDPVTAATARVVNRGAMAYEDETEPLMQDWIATDLRSPNTGDPLTLTISGLPGGTYTWVSYHHDTNTSATVGSADVTVNDAAGSATTMDIRCTNNTVTTFDGVKKFEATITSDGVNPVTIVYDLRPFTNQWNECFFIINGFDLTLQFIRGAATDPVPLTGPVDSQTTTAVSWAGSVDPNIVSISGYDVVFGAEPNMLLNPVYTVSSASLPLDGVNGPAPLDYDTTYYWRVDTHVVWDSNDITGSLNDTVTGSQWAFTTLPDDLTPVVVAGDDVLTSLELLPASLTGSVNDHGESDIASIDWQIVGSVSGAVATITDTTNDASSATQSATFTTDTPGSYIIQLTATDNAAQPGADTMTVTVAADACAAAQLSTSWTGFSAYDFDTDCVVDIDDIVAFAAGWLNDRNLTGQE